MKRIFTRILFTRSTILAAVLADQCRPQKRQRIRARADCHAKRIADHIIRLSHSYREKMLYQLDPAGNAESDQHRQQHSDPCRRADEIRQ